MPRRRYQTDRAGPHGNIYQIAPLASDPRLEGRRGLGRRRSPRPARRSIGSKVQLGGEFGEIRDCDRTNDRGARLTLRPESLAQGPIQCLLLIIKNGGYYAYDQSSWPRL